MTLKHKKRTSLSTLTAAVVTAGLFFTMSQLVASDEVRLDARINTTWVDTIGVLEDKPITDYEETVVEPPKKLSPPKTDLPKPPEPCMKGCFSLPQPPTPGGDGPVDVDPIGTDRGAIFLVSSPPQYPAGPLNRGIEGYVTLSFTIDAEGMVQNPRIIDAEPEGMFDKASLKAIKRFKFKPAMMGGVPQSTHNVYYKLTYELP